MASSGKPATAGTEAKALSAENARTSPADRDLAKRLTEALEQQVATSEILRVISGARNNVQPVFDTIAVNALRLCDARFSTVFRFDGELIHLAAFHNLDAEGTAAFRTAYPCRPGRGGATQRAILTRSIVHIADTREDPEYVYKDVAQAADYRSVLSVPMLRDGQAIGTISVYSATPGAFPDSQVELLKTFAEQAMIAAENTRLFTELEARNQALTEALDQQTATSDILRVISRSPTDVQPVFDTIVAATMKLCRASAANVYSFDGELIHLVALVNVNPEYFAAIHQVFPRPPSRDTAVGRAILSRSVVVITDVLEDPEYAIGTPTLAGGLRSVLAVPLIRDEEPIGAIILGAPEPGPFPSKQIALLQTFADQAVIAIENVRLFKALEARNRDLTQALEQQTATSEILRVISGSRTDVQPVFDIIAERAARLCEADVGVVSRVDGDVIELAALHGMDPEGADIVRAQFPMRPGRETVSARVVRGRSVVHVPDVLADQGYEAKDAARAARYRCCLGVPMLREGQVIGVIFVARAKPELFADTQVELLKTFAEQAVIAVENVRLFNELQARTKQLTRSVEELGALREVGQAVSSTLDLETVLATIASRATQLTGMDGGAIYEYDEAREEFYLHTADRLPDELIEALRATPIRKGEGALGRMAVTGEPVQIRDIVDETAYQSRVRETLLRLGYRALLAVPLLREDHLLGGLVVNRKSAGAFDSEVVELLKSLATQSALAIQNARLFREIEDKSRQIATASRHKSEFLANMSHELRTPLNAIIGFSEVLSERMFGEINDKQAEYLADILESGRHLLSLINDILDLSKIEAGRMELETTDFDLRAVIDNTLILVRERAHRHGITLECTTDASLGSIHADERKVKQVLLNLLSNALKFTPEGGRVEVRAIVRDGEAEISVSDTGVGIAPEDQATVFEEFRQVGPTAKKVEGTGLGLAISRKFIQLHGGRIWLNSRLGSGSTFTFALPLRESPRQP